MFSITERLGYIGRNWQKPLILPERFKPRFIPFWQKLVNPDASTIRHVPYERIEICISF